MRGGQSRRRKPGNMSLEGPATTAEIWVLGEKGRYSSDAVGDRLSISLPEILLASLGLWSMGRIKLREQGRVLKELCP